MRCFSQMAIQAFCVSIHAPARGAIPSRADTSHVETFQFTHPQGVRLQKDKRIFATAVSIHAPARGAILSYSSLSVSIWFQFTHPQGVRSCFLRFLDKHLCFNSRTRKGCDIQYQNFCGVSMFQFTHPQGVRLPPGTTAHSLPVSIHAPARGAIMLTLIRDVKGEFQFTHPQGVRFLLVKKRLLRPSFNSRTRKGCDFSWSRSVSYAQVSIHAPARGAIAGMIRKIKAEQFQFTHPQGVRSGQRAAGLTDFVSIHAPARGAILPGWHFFH